MVKVPDLDVDKLQDILRDFKRGSIEADDIIEVMQKRMGVTQDQATFIVASLFPDVDALRPIATNKTLRSHMTGTWCALSALSRTRASIRSPCSPSAHATATSSAKTPTTCASTTPHQLSSWTRICSSPWPRRIAKDILKKFGFSDARFETKLATSTYYAPSLAGSIRQAEWRMG